MERLQRKGAKYYRKHMQKGGNKCTSKRKKMAKVAANELEKTLRRRLVKVLHHCQQSLNFIFFHVKNDVGIRRGRFFYDLKPDGVLSGVADFCFLKEDSVEFLEIKTCRGVLSDNQKLFIKDASSLGYKVHVAYGWEDIVEKVNQILGVEKTIPILELY